MSKLRKIRIALIAHDGKKEKMLEFVKERYDFFNQEDVLIVATGTTGKLIQDSNVCNVTCVNSGPLGGDAEIGAMVSTNLLDLVIFFRDPLGKHPHEPDVQMLMRLCDVHNVPLSTNYASANLILKSI